MNEQSTKVKDVMKSDPECIPPEASLQEAAQRMKELNCGVLPVGQPGTPEGVITDRDIVVRAVAEGKDLSQTKVQECMTSLVYTCAANETLEDAARKMHEYSVGRLLVEENGQVCGIVSFGRMLRMNDNTQENAQVVECAVKDQAA